jgi:SAM-dependent methyltransferase
VKLVTSTLAPLAALAAMFALALLAAPSSRGNGEPSSVRPGGGAAAPAAGGAPDRSGTEGELFRPENLVLLEGPDRAEWQQPELVMDELHIADGSDVADIGAGAGWFTIRLAERVGPNGTVYAQDLQQPMVTAIGRRVKREDLRNVQLVLGQDNSPNLPLQALDAVLVVDVYPEVPGGERVMFLRNLATALRPRGRIGIVNHKPGGGGPGPEPRLRVPRRTVEEDAEAAGLHVLSCVDLRYQYLVVLGLQPAGEAERGSGPMCTPAPAPPLAESGVP